METNLTASFFDRVAKDYEAAYATNRPLLELVHKAAADLPPSSAILDVGSGTGKPVAEILAAANHRVHGIDRSQVMVDLARKQIPSATFELADMLAYSPANPYDAVFAIFVFFALTRRQHGELLARIADWLKPGALVHINALAADDYDSDPKFPIEEAQWDGDGLFVSGVEHKFMGDVVQIAMLTTKGWELELDRVGLEVVEARKATFEPANGQLYGKHVYFYITARRRE